MIRKVLLSSLFVFSTLSTSANADVVPSGISFNVSEDSVQDWGFLECYAKTSSSLPGVRFNDIKDSCSSDEILFGVRNSSTKNFFILATGKKDVVFNYIPKQSGVFYLDNWSGGVNWYLNETSFGFTSAGSVRQNSADTNLQNVNTAGLSIHTGGAEDSLVASSPWAYSKYNTTSVIGINNPSYEIAFFTKSSDVPISLALGGLGLLGLSFKRKKRVAT